MKKIYTIRLGFQFFSIKPPTLSMHQMKYEENVTRIYAKSSFFFEKT